MRRGQGKRCRCGKAFYSSFRKAQHVVNRTEAERVYFCYEAGGYHITGVPKGEWNAAQAARLAG